MLLPSFCIFLFRNCVAAHRVRFVLLMNTLSSFSRWCATLQTTPLRWRRLKKTLLHFFSTPCPCIFTTESQNEINVCILIVRKFCIHLAHDTGVSQELSDEKGNSLYSEGWTQNTCQLLAVYAWHMRLYYHQIGGGALLESTATDTDRSIHVDVRYFSYYE